FFYVSLFFFSSFRALRAFPSFPTRRSSDLLVADRVELVGAVQRDRGDLVGTGIFDEVLFVRIHHSLPRAASIDLEAACEGRRARSEEHTSELQSPDHLVCRLLLEKKNKTTQ